MDRVFLSQGVAAGSEGPLHPDDARHLRQVLRRRVGDALWVSDGRGQEAPARISRMDGRGVWVRVGQWQSSPREPALQVVLAQAVLKGERMDWLVQKATELGVARLVPLLTARTVVKLEGQQARHRQERWQKIAREAARQSQRSLIPVVEEPQPFQAWLEGQRWRRAEGEGETGWGTGPGPGSGVAFIPYEEERQTSLAGWLEAAPLRQGPIPPAGVTLLVGPEGGWEPAEVEAACRRGAVAVGLGPRILRAETAGMVALALVMAGWGDLR